MEKKQKLSELRKGLTIYPQLLKNVRVGDKPTAKTIDVVAATEEVAKALGDNGRI